MKNFINTLDGKKTYIVAIIIAVLNLLVALNVISPSHISQINFLLTALGLGALRSAVAKVE